MTPLARLAAVAVAAAALGVTLAAAPAAVPAGAHPAARRQEPGTGAVRQPAPTPPMGQAIPASLELLEQTTWLDPGDRFEAELLVSRPPTGAAVQVVVHEPLLSRSAFQESLDGELGEAVLDGPVRPLASLTPPAPLGGRITVDVGTGDGAGEADLGQGVHPVEIRLLDAGSEVVTNLVTYAVVVPPDLDGLSPLAVSVIVDVAGPPSLQPDGSVAVSSDTLDRVGERVELLEQAPLTRLTVAPQPETLDGLAGGGSRATRLLDRLVQATAGRPVLARPYTDVDIAALLDAGLIAETNFQAQGGADVVRSRFGVEPVPGVWLPAGTVGDEAAHMLVDLGVGQAVVSPEAVADVPGVESAVPEEPVRLGEGGPVAMVSDPVLADRLTGDDVLDAERFVAELAMTWLERPAIARGVVVRLPADADVEPDVVARALNELADSPVLQARPVAELFDAVPPVDGDAPPEATPAPHEVTAELGKLRQPIDTARRRVGGFAGLVGNVDAGRSLEHSLLMATGATTPDAERRVYVDRVSRELAQLANVVNLPEEFRITLTSRSSTIPLNLTNGSGTPIDVRIELESDQLEFPDGNVITTRLEPGATRLDIAVRTRASGAFPLDIFVTSPDGSILLADTRFDIRSTAVSGVGLVLSVAAGLFLAVWWARHWRSAQRSRRLLPPEEITPAAGTAAVDGESGGGRTGPSPPGSTEDPAGHRGPYRPAHMAGPRAPDR